MQRAFSLFVLPQLSLTLTNAIVLTALIAGDYFGERAAHVTPARLSITSGLANLLLTPFRRRCRWCHGAGGLAAHYRFGARSGTAPLVLGLALLAFALLPGGLGRVVAGRHTGGRAGRAAADGRRRVGADAAPVRLQTVLPAGHRRNGGAHCLGRPVLGSSGRLRVRKLCAAPPFAFCGVGART